MIYKTGCITSIYIHKLVDTQKMLPYTLLEQDPVHLIMPTSEVRQKEGDDQGCGRKLAVSLAQKNFPDQFTPFHDFIN